MKKSILVFFFLVHFSGFLWAQVPKSLSAAFPEGTEMYTGIAYAADTMVAHTLDIYLPPHAVKSPPLLVWVHGGGWRAGTRYNDMDYMKSTIKSLLDSGYALATIEYRYSQTARFPAQIQDCNRALNFLYRNASKYNYDADRLALLGFSAGGYLAALMGTSANNHLKNFYAPKEKPLFKIRAVVDFFGPADFIARIGSMPLDEGTQETTTTGLLGVQPVLCPALAKEASATTYVDKADPPFLIFHGDKDTTVPVTLSKLLETYLKQAGVPARLVVVPGAPHGGPLFGTESVRIQMMEFLRQHLNVSSPKKR